MTVEIVRDYHGDLHVHAAGCRDLSNLRRYPQDDRSGQYGYRWEIEAETRLDVAREVYGPGDRYLASTLSGFEFAPCAGALR